MAGKSNKHVIISLGVPFEVKFGKYASYTNGKFELNTKGSMILKNSQLIISQSGMDFWCNHFICELLDLYSGLSEYNFMFGTVNHQKDIARLWHEDSNTVIAWFTKHADSDWLNLAAEAFDNIMISIENKCCSSI